MKKPLITSLFLIAVDQAVKLVILRLAPHASVTLIPGALYFRPVQNTNLNWFASMANFNTPVWMMVLTQLLLAVLVVLAYRYFVYRENGREKFLSLFLAFTVAGIGCSFIDVVFWGGSLDFVGLFNWFVFDIKDLYLNVSVVALALHEITRSKRMGNGSQINRTGFTRWLRLGCPMKPCGGGEPEKG